MKHPFWSDPNDSVAILEPTDAAVDEYGHRCGSDMIWLEQKHIEALLSGKILAWHDSEHSTFVGIKDIIVKKVVLEQKEQD